MAIDVGTAVKGVRWLAIIIVCACCAACTTTQAPDTRSSKGYVSGKPYSVKASPRAAHRKNIRKAGGRYVVGKPYVVKGKRYYPKEDPNYDRKGVASWYSSAFRGRLTANGEVYYPNHLSAAHTTLPLPSYVRVTNLENGSSLIVRVNDRGPYHKGRIIDLSSKAAEMLDLKHRGTASVRVQYVGRARLGGHDMPYLMASYVKKGDRFPAVNPEPQIATGVMVAQNHLRRDGQSLWSTQTNLAGNGPSASYQTASNAAAALQTFEQPVMLPEIGPVTFERQSEYTPSVSRNTAIASADQEIGFMSEVHRRVGMITAEATVRDVVTPDVKYCLGEESDDGVRDTCELQVLPLPGVDRNKRLTGATIRRRRSCQSGYRWRGTTISLTYSAARLFRRAKDAVAL
ncbi:septal ring lytic transglycosylase RlpA family protein [Ensifer sp. IC3342]|nr:septal ring lytic transglycosylase RlpA family protein [Ensifer sp. BRP08]MCA1447731.1 septal ring lytic transglycosylase RlpA family protein [Ensifer sp. IC3342]